MIEVKNIFASFDSHPVLKNVTFCVKEGQSLCIIGPSGSGKTTLLKIIAGLLPTESGQVKIKSLNMSMLFQQSALFDSMSVYENLFFPLEERMPSLLKKQEEKVDQYLEIFGLKESAHLMPSQISGGMQKRLALARALIIEPDVLLLDEPLSGLDPANIKKILEYISPQGSELNRIIKKPLTKIFATTQNSIAKLFATEHFFL